VKFTAANKSIDYYKKYGFKFQDSNNVVMSKEDVTELLSKHSEEIPVVKESVQAEIEKRVKSLVDKKRREFKKQQQGAAPKSKKKLDSAHKEEKITADSPLKETPDELTPHDADGIKDDNTQLLEDISDLEQQLERELPELEEEVKGEKEKKSLTPHEDETIAKVQQLGKALKDGVECMVKKAI
jgi:hypothetical protein